jgi:hypothetical protein
VNGANNVIQLKKARVLIRVFPKELVLLTAGKASATQHVTIQTAAATAGHDAMAKFMRQEQAHAIRIADAVMAHGRQEHASNQKPIAVQSAGRILIAGQQT